MVSSERNSFGLEPERQHPPSVVPLGFQHCFELDSCAAAAGVPAPLTPPSVSSRRDSHAQPHKLPRRSSSRKAAAPSSSGRANRPGARTLRYVSTSTKNSEKLLLSTRSPVYISGQNFSASQLLSLVFFCSGALTRPMAVTAALAFFRGHFRTFFSLAFCCGKPMGFRSVSHAAGLPASRAQRPSSRDHLPCNVQQPRVELTAPLP